jgi:hypothetical protein
VLGPAVFALGICDVIVAANDKFPHVLIRAYPDDITLAAPKECLAELEECKQLLQEAFALRGLSFNAKKCHVACRDWSIALAFARKHGMVCGLSRDFEARCIKILGAFVGDDDACAVAAKLLAEQQCLLTP